MVQPVAEETGASLAEAADAPTVTNPLNPEVQKLVQEYSHLFQEPTSLPPQRDQDHAIPLLPGAQPFKIRPYRYSLQQKDETEAGL